MYFWDKVGWKQFHFCYLVLYFLFKSKPELEKLAQETVPDS